MIRGLLADFGNVLARVQREVTCRILSQYSPFDPQTLCQRVYSREIEEASETGRLDARGHFEAVAEAAELDQECTFYQFANAWHAGLLLIQESTTALTNLAGAGFPVWVLSNISAIHKAWFLDQDELRPLHSKSLFSCDLGVMKPDSRAFSAAFTAMSMSPNEVLFIDDRLENCRAAHAAGCATSVIEEPERDVPEICRQLQGSIL